MNLKTVVPGGLFAAFLVLFVSASCSLFNIPGPSQKTDITLAITFPDLKVTDRQLSASSLGPRALDPNTDLISIAVTASDISQPMEFQVHRSGTESTVVTTLTDIPLGKDRTFTVTASTSGLALTSGSTTTDISTGQNNIPVRLIPLPESTQSLGTWVESGVDFNYSGVDNRMQFFKVENPTPGSFGVRLTINGVADRIFAYDSHGVALARIESSAISGESTAYFGITQSGESELYIGLLDIPDPEFNLAVNRSLGVSANIAAGTVIDDQTPITLSFSVPINTAAPIPLGTVTDSQDLRRGEGSAYETVSAVGTDNKTLRFTPASYGWTKGQDMEFGAVFTDVYGNVYDAVGDYQGLTWNIGITVYVDPNATWVGASPAPDVGRIGNPFKYLDDAVTKGNATNEGDERYSSSWNQYSKIVVANRGSKSVVTPGSNLTIGDPNLGGLKIEGGYSVSGGAWTRVANTYSLVDNQYTDASTGTSIYNLNSSDTLDISGFRFTRGTLTYFAGATNQVTVQVQGGFSLRFHDNIVEQAAMPSSPGNPFQVIALSVEDSGTNNAYIYNNTILGTLHSPASTDYSPYESLGMRIYNGNNVFLFNNTIEAGGFDATDALVLYVKGIEFQEATGYLYNNTIVAGGYTNAGAATYRGQYALSDYDTGSASPAMTKYLKNNLFISKNGGFAPDENYAISMQATNSSAPAELNNNAFANWDKVMAWGVSEPTLFDTVIQAWADIYSNGAAGAGNVDGVDVTTGTVLTTLSSDMTGSPQQPGGYALRSSASASLRTGGTVLSSDTNAAGLITNGFPLGRDKLGASRTGSGTGWSIGAYETD